MSKQKILRIVNTIEETSGPYNQITLPFLREQEITLCSYFKPGVIVPDAMKCFSGDGSFRGFFRALKNAFSSSTYDVIHLHHPQVGFLYFLYNALANRRIKSNAIFTLHTSFPNLKLQHKLMILPVFTFFKKIVYCSRSSRQTFPSFFRWLVRRRDCVIRNGVDINRIDRVITVENKEFHSKGITAVSIGRFIELKNLSVLIDAFKRCCQPDDSLILIGEGYLRKRISEQIKNCGLEQNVRLLGMIGREEVYRYLFNADVFISTSKKEGFPVAVLEAMACGCPVILSDIPAHREIRKELDSIPLIDCTDPEGFSQHIAIIKRMDIKQRKQLGQIHRMIAQQKFSIETMLDEYRYIFNEGTIALGGVQ